MYYVFSISTEFGEYLVIVHFVFQLTLVIIMYLVYNYFNKAQAGCVTGFLKNYFAHEVVILCVYASRQLITTCLK